MSVSKNKGKVLSDKEYWQKCCQGDEKALFCLLERYHIQLFGIAYAMTKKENIAQEVLREVFVQLHQKSKEKHLFKDMKGALIEMTKKLSLSAAGKQKEFAR